MLYYRWEIRLKWMPIEAVFYWVYVHMCTYLGHSTCWLCVYVIDECVCHEKCL